MSTEIILASTSSYRRELLQRIIPDFRCEAPGVDERAFERPGRTPVQLATLLAAEKCHAVARQFPESLVIGSDQVAELDGTLLGKPGTTSAAVDQIIRLAGSTHRLLTAVCVISPHGRAEFLNETRLTMRPLSTAEAIRYVERDQPLDCAGSYRIESLGITLFSRIETSDFTAIMGLPLLELSQHLRSLGCVIP